MCLAVLISYFSCIFFFQRRRYFRQCAVCTEISVGSVDVKNREGSSTALINQLERNLAAKSCPLVVYTDVADICTADA